MKTSDTVNCLLADIDNIIERHDNSNLGLFTGYSGMAILLFLMGKKTGDIVFENKAMLLLDRISDHIQSVEALDFQHGLAGVGWAVEWLVQYDLLKDTNTDEVLADLDDTLYKSIVYAREKNISLSNGLLGKIAYFLKRDNSIISGTHRFKRIMHQECLVLLTDDLEEKLTGSGGILASMNLYDDVLGFTTSLSDLADVLLIVSTIKELNKLTIKNIIAESVKRVELLFSDLNNLFKHFACHAHLEMYYAMFYLAVSYQQAAKNLRKNAWKILAEKVINQLHYQLIEYQDLPESLIFNRLAIYSLLGKDDKNTFAKQEIFALRKSMSAEALLPSLRAGYGSFLLAELILEGADRDAELTQLIFF